MLTNPGVSRFPHDEGGGSKNQNQAAGARAGWYVDPMNPSQVRWWDGQHWSEHSQKRPEAQASVSRQLSARTFAAKPKEQQLWLRPIVWIAAGTAAVVLASAAGAAFWLTADGRTNTAFLQALRAGGLGGEYSSDANAVAAGRAVCEGLRGGGEQAGWPKDKVAVHFYCSEFEQGFHVLREITVNGSLTLVDTSTSLYTRGISSDGAVCSGAGGYGDINASTSVVLKSGSGETLATVPLGMGTGDSFECEFTFSLPVREGESDYVLNISDRGDQHYTFTELEQEPPNLTLGD